MAACPASRFELFALLTLVACGQSATVPAAMDAVAPATELVAVAVPTLMLPGSVVIATTRGLLASSPVTLALTGSEISESIALSEVSSDGPVRRFELDAAAAAALGPGDHALTVHVVQGAVDSSRLNVTWRLRESLDATLGDLPSGRTHRGDVLILRGDGLVSAGEGRSEVLVDGTFRKADGTTSTVAAIVPVNLSEALDRTRGEVVLTSAVGGVASGLFEGTARLRTTLRSGEVSESAPLVLWLEIPPPEVFGIAKTNVALGELALVDGAGFIGGPDRPDEATLLRFDGTFVSDDGIERVMEGDEVLLDAGSGREARFPVAFAVDGTTLVSTFFGAMAGRFTGTITPRLVRGTESTLGAGAPVTLDLVGVHQQAVVVFLPGFHASLERFGLALARAEVEAGVLARLRALYAPYAITFHLDAPVDFEAAAVSRIELGGADPTGVGLFGYDNTPGKDVWNLRLADHIGGANAEVQQDGEPGYGGVFIESMLWWSSHPDLPIARPSGAPEPDPLFDAIFDPVRAAPASRAEIEGQGAPDRVEQVARAIAALSSVVGETAAHELGHSLGLAEPYAGPTVFHNRNPGAGCLMDAGADRPFGERAAQPGFDESRFCSESQAYLSEILLRSP